jgi:hypothetical protein
VLTTLQKLGLEELVKALIGKSKDFFISFSGNPEQVTPLENNYKLPEQVDPITGKPVIQTNIDNNSTDLNQNEKQEGVVNDNNIEENQNVVKLLPEEIKHIQHVYDENTNYLFPNNEADHAWDNVKDKTPDDIFQVEKANGLNETYKPFASYLHRLEEMTKLNPRTATIDNPNPETNVEYIIRALRK